MKKKSIPSTPSRELASTQSTHELDTTQSNASTIKKSETTQTGTIDDEKQQQPQQHKVLELRHHSDVNRDSDSSETTQENSKNEGNDVIESVLTPIKLPGRKLDAPPKKLRPPTPTSPTPHHKGLLPPQVLRRKVLTGGTDEKLHRRRCYEYQRKRTRKAAGSTTHRLRSKDFLRAVDRHRNSRNVIDCVCEPQRFGCLRSLQFYVSQAGRQTSSCLATFCCPPLPSKCVAKVAFWPPNRGYFFVYYDKQLPWSSNLVQNHKIVKAQRTIALEENFSLGLEHGCCDRVHGVQTFVIQNSYKNYIAGFVAKPHKKGETKLWIIYSHPNGSDLSDLMTLMPSPVQVADYLGANVVAYDYPGYGISTGKSIEDCFYATIEAIINYVHKTLGVPLESIVLWGYSIGTVCSVHAAMTLPVAGIFLFAPVASIMRTMKSNTCFDNGKVQDKTSCLDSFSSLDMISRVKCPILIAHGEMDGLIPKSHGEALLKRAQTTNSKAYGFWPTGVGHNNIPNSSELWKRVKQYIDHEITNAENLRFKPLDDGGDAISKKSKKSHRSSKKRKRDKTSKPSKVSTTKAATAKKENKKNK